MSVRLVRGRAATRIALALAVVVVGLAVTALAWPRVTAAQVRRQLWADVRAGRTDGCESALRWLRRHDRINTQDLMIEARVQLVRGRFAEALATLERIGPDDPLAPQVRLMVGQIEMERHRARPAEAALRAALALDPRMVAARYELIRLYSRQQRLRELVVFHLLDRNQASLFTIGPGSDHPFVSDEQTAIAAY